MCLKKVILFVGFLALACQAATTGEDGILSADLYYAKPGVTVIGDDPWFPPAPQPRPKVIYGEDDRIDVYQETDAQRINWTNSTCALINVSRLTQHSDGSWTISSPAAYTRWGLYACDGEPFGNQPTAANCTAFMVGDDLIATAGHCYSASSLSSMRFVFGFWMLDENTPRLHFDESEVYQGVEVVSFSSSGAYDHSLVRVDRTITSPGAYSLPIRREDTIQPGEFVGVIGHPSGLPMKIAFGNTFVRNSEQTGYFVANLDTYGGNSGSPVFNAGTGLVEGILVRGATDFVRDYEDNCFRSNHCPDDGCRGEDVTKTTVFESHVPYVGPQTGSIALDRNAYPCDDMLTVTVIDPDLIGETQVTVYMETSSGDSEMLALSVDGTDASKFDNVIVIQQGVPVPDSGVLEVYHHDIVTAYYSDEADETGQPFTHTASATMFCVTPQVLSVHTPYVSGSQARITVETDMTARVKVHYGRDCSAPSLMAGGTWNSSHLFALSGLSANTVYYFVLTVEDEAGNLDWVDDDGNCFSFHTRANFSYFTEFFSSLNPVNLSGKQLTLIPGDYQDYYQACMEDAAALPVAPGGQLLALGDDEYVEALFDHGAAIPFYGAAYDRMFVGSNGYITFGAGDIAHQPMYSSHFQLPRISPLMCDLNPARRGAVYFARISDRYVVTFVDVPVYSSTNNYPNENTHTFQTELFFTGAIRITWLNLFATSAVVGLSAGLGVPGDYVSTNLSAQTDCDSSNPDGIYHSADTDANGRISFDELLQVIQLYNVGQYHCDPAFGYAPGDGPRDCLPHDSDYAPTDWRISLSELLRLIQLYNAGAYLPDPTTEDGFRPAP